MIAQKQNRIFFCNFDDSLTLFAITFFAIDAFLLYFIFEDKSISIPFPTTIHYQHFLRKLFLLNHISIDCFVHDVEMLKSNNISNAFKYVRNLFAHFSRLFINVSIFSHFNCNSEIHHPIGNWRDWSVYVWTRVECCKHTSIVNALVVHDKNRKWIV